MPVVLGGGCFQNTRLVESISKELRIFMNHEIPPGDGGIALGQALVADAQLRAGRARIVPQEVPACV